MEPDRSTARFSFGVVILAAGASSRMGKPKLLLPWGETSVLGHLIRQWHKLRAKQIAVVHATFDQPLCAELDRLRVPSTNRIVNPQPDRGMFSSVQCAANWGGWNSALTHRVIVLGDQPHLRIETLRALLDFAATCPRSICQPGRHGRPRHPVVMPKAIFSRLKNSSEETLKQFLQQSGSEPVLCEMDDTGLDFDMDTPADYEQALRLSHGRSG
ncbi:MAG TPA: nucleotidyltransferase family protein [Candidatus Angelobacter sp.]|nr:nucleotidyltransferase family protein [Candidatus Angelobacter sp.]